MTLTTTPVTHRLLPADGSAAGLAAHLERHGRLPALRPDALLDEVARSGLTGRGGAAFPLHRKLLAVAGAARAAGREAAVVANGAESEPASTKDRTLLTHAPHLVLDGLQVAAAAVGAGRAVAYVHPDAVAAVRMAVAERAAAGGRRAEVEVVEAPPGFVSGQETAVVRHLDGGPALPRSAPPRVCDRGVGGRPTLVSNVETLAHLALLARHGAGWFRGAGTPEEPGTALCTVTDPYGRQTVVEVPLGTPLVEVLARAGERPGALRGLLVGGYHGAWVTAAEVDRPLSVAGLRTAGAVPGAGVLAVLGHDQCPVAVTARVVRYLAGASARQCGPCLNGLPALATTLALLAGGSRSPELPARLGQLTRLVDGRGACAHPDGTVRLLRSLLTTWPDELSAHARGACPVGGAR